MLRMDQGRTPKVALRWTPPGKRKTDGPNNTWCRTIGGQLKAVKLTWAEAQKIAKDRDEWRQIVEALFPKWEEVTSHLTNSLKIHQQSSFLMSVVGKKPFLASVHHMIVSIFGFCLILVATPIDGQDRAAVSDYPDDVLPPVVL